jgi:hypothetical protein
MKNKIHFKIFLFFFFCYRSIKKSPPRDFVLDCVKIEKEKNYQYYDPLKDKNLKMFFTNNHVKKILKTQNKIQNQVKFK